MAPPSCSTARRSTNPRTRCERSSSPSRASCSSTPMTTRRHGRTGNRRARNAGGRAGPRQLVVPIGGGGLCAGVASRRERCNPASASSAWRRRSIRPSSTPSGRGPPDRRADAGGGHRRQDRRLVDPADRARPRRGDRPRRRAAIESAVNCYATLARTMAEGAGAAGLAAMLA